MSIKHQHKTRSGTATVEMVLAIPLLGTVLALIFFIGYAMVNQQGVWMSDRYAAWSTLKGGSAGANRLNTSFMRDKGAGVNVDFSETGRQTIDDYLVAVGKVSGPAHTLADRTAGQQVQGFPHGVSADVQAQFPSSVGLWQRYNGPIQSSHRREGVPWRRGEAMQMKALVEQFLGDFDAVMPADIMGQRIRLLYTREW